jgi:hypothetical protein
MFPPAGSSGRSAVAVRRTSRTTTPHGIACMAVPSSSFFPASLHRSSRKQTAARGRDRQGPDGDRTERDGPRTTNNKSPNTQTNKQTSAAPRSARPRRPTLRGRRSSRRQRRTFAKPHRHLAAAAGCPRDAAQREGARARAARRRAGSCTRSRRCLHSTGERHAGDAIPRGMVPLMARYP